MHDAPRRAECCVPLPEHREKRALTLDIQSQTGVCIVQRLARECDILVESFPAGYLDQPGLGYAVLERLHPGLIYTSVTPFGQTGPYRDYKGSELVAQAMGALMHTIGLPDKEPLRIAGMPPVIPQG